MKQHGKRWLSVLLMTVMLLSNASVALAQETQPQSADADGFESESYFVAYVNPAYQDVIAEEDLLDMGVALMPLGEPVGIAEPEITFYTDVDGAAVEIKAAFMSRTDTVTVGYSTAGPLSEEEVKTLAKGIVNTALAHTGVPDEGDYIANQYAGYTCSVSGRGNSSVYQYQFAYKITYFTTAEQELEVDAAVEAVLDTLDVYDGTDYEKIRAIYDYICDNITYDYENLEDATYTRKHTAYAALMDKTCVCQGYAVLFYRLALELGVDARYIYGVALPTNEAHGWNIVELDDLYYNLDATWDAGMSVYSYFLKSPDNFGDHRRDAMYDAAFDLAYPMATADYVPGAPAEPVEPAVKPGDVNGDGNVNTTDLGLLRRALAGGYSLTGYVEEAADVNDDGKVNTTDLGLMRRYLAGGYGVVLG